MTIRPQRLGRRPFPQPTSQASALLTVAVLAALSASARSQRQFEGLGTRGLPANADHTTSTVVGDVDGDGDLDLVVGNFTYPGEQSRLYINDGRNRFTDETATRLPAGLHRTGALAIGDVDGDGDLDLVLANRNEASLLYLNDGTGTFSDATAGRLQVYGLSIALALGDVDGDGDLDLVVGNYYFQTSQLLLNDGTGTFTDVTAGRLPVSAGFRTYALIMGDVDGDGDLDLISGNVGQQARLYLNDGTGTFSEVTGTHMPVAFDPTNALDLGDVDGDGDLDLVIGNRGGQSRLYLNGGTGVFTDVTASNLPAGVLGTKGVSLFDIDGDGDLDLALGDWGDQSRLYMNGGGGVFIDVTVFTMPVAPNDQIHAISIGDMDGDGDLDMVLGNDSMPTRLYLNRGTGVFTDAANSRIPGIMAHTDALAVGDVDLDGDADLVLGNYGEQSRLYLNDGFGRLGDGTAAAMPAANSFTAALALGDVDGDGDPDLVVGNGGRFSGQQSNLYLNSGTGTFVDATAAAMPAANHQTTALVLGDVDGDGDLDLVLGNYYGRSRLCLNNGAGVFTDVSATRLPSLTQSTTALALGDVDGDGDLDLVVGNGGYYGGQSRLYLNDGTGTFADATAARMPASTQRTTSLALGDVDGDGDLDLAVGNDSQPGGGGGRLYVNDGTGTFADATAARMPVGAHTTMSLALGDVDEDGDLDLVVGNDGQDLLFVNDGTGVFTDATTTRMRGDVDSTRALALADLDMDGDLDLLVGNDGQSRLDVNLLRQLDAPEILQVGSTYQLDVFSRYGPASAGDTAFPLLSTGTARISFPPLGTIGIDLNQAVALGSFVVPQPAGIASMTLPVPNLPGLVGIPIYTQVLLIQQPAQARLTNVVGDTFQ